MSDENFFFWRMYFEDFVSQDQLSTQSNEEEEALIRKAQQVISFYFLFLKEVSNYFVLKCLL